MRNLLDVIWWWTRVAVLALVGIYVLALLFENAGKATRLWYWWGRESDDTPIITIVVVSFLTGGIATMTGWALLTATIRYRRTRESRRERVAFEQREAMHQKAARLRVKPQPIARPRVEPPMARVFASASASPPVAIAPASVEPSVEPPVEPASSATVEMPVADLNAASSDEPSHLQVAEHDVPRDPV